MPRFYNATASRYWLQVEYRLTFDCFRVNFIMWQTLLTILHLFVRVTSISELPIYAYLLDKNIN